MGLMKHLYCLLWLFGLLSLINNSAAQSQSKRSSRITSSRTSFGTNVKSPSPSSSSSSNSNGVNFDCPEEFGYYPHPTDCTQYYVCVFGGALLESCTGGLMYSHELQTCDWPRNVGCEVVDSGDRDVVISKQQQQQQQPQHVPSRVRFGSSFTSPQAQQQPLQQQQQQQQVLKPTVPPQYHRQPPQVIQAQVQTIPPPPQLKVSPNPVITSRGQPKHLLDAQEEIAKLYADAHDSLPPVEEEESDRQQRVYRGQPSTVSQVQKDRDGILHQASINAIPSNDKYNSYNFGSQYRDIEYQQQQQHQQQQQQYQQPIRQSTYRPLDVFTTPAPQSAPRETYKPQPQPPRQQERPTYTNQQPLVYNSDYDEDLIAQIEQDNAYDQPTRPPPSRYTTPTSNGQSSASSSSSGSRTIASGTTPKYYPKFPSSTFSVLSSSSTTTTTSRPPPSNNKKFSSTQPAYTATTTTTTTNTQTNTANTNSNQSGKTATVASSGASGAASPVLPPARVSRVNSALKSSIAAAAATATIPSSSSSSTLNANSAASSGGSTSARNAHNNKFSLGSAVKCSDTTSNAKCNEIPSRLNSNSNRNRGSSSSSSNSYNQGDIGSAPVTSNRGTHPPRTRPTLKPSGTIVSKAQEFIDIYKNPPSRPEPLYPQPTPDKTAAKCRKDVCLLPDCYCGGKDIPGDLPVESVPQIVLITFDDSVNDLNKQLYIDLFEKGRVNPNGCPITATFYVSHEWTDYSQVQNLYADGHEMASHTVSHSFGEQFSQKKWTREVAGQREILAAYGGVKLSDVRGMRAPFLSVGGNKMFKMLYDSNFTYDSSMPVYENRPPSWPYTLDYKIFHDCMIPPCPTKSYPGVWQVPMVMWQDLNGGRCSMGDACSNPSEAEGVTKMIMKNFERHYTTNRAPFGLFYHAAWFTQPHHKEGFIKFLDTINAMPDVWIVTNWQALQWVRDPTPLSRINSFQPFQCDYSDRPKRCNNPKVCNLWHKSGVRYMKTCQPCPDIYPWTGKTGIRSSRIDNDIEDSTA
ncbi:chitin deacetylase-like 5 isoform X22 [Musca autumnalis]|uniref:chitin deacetylase-like 5 isoform X22 n=1 Tax=Musca autumnalis TaxID=221902 RepID=UPI003CF8368F